MSAERATIHLCCSDGHLQVVQTPKVAVAKETSVKYESPHCSSVSAHAHSMRCGGAGAPNSQPSALLKEAGWDDTRWDSVGMHVGVLLEMLWLIVQLVGVESESLCGPAAARDTNISVQDCTAILQCEDWKRSGWLVPDVRWMWVLSIAKAACHDHTREKRHYGILLTVLLHWLICALCQ